MSKKRHRQTLDNKNPEAQVQAEVETGSVEAKEPEAEPQATATIDEVTYTLDSLGQQGREQLQNLQVTDQEIRRLQDQLAIMQTARNTYARILADVARNVAPQT